MATLSDFCPGEAGWVLNYYWTQYFSPGVGVHGHSFSMVFYLYFSPAPLLLVKFLLPHLFSNAERDIFVFYHVHDLALHCQDK